MTIGTIILIAFVSAVLLPVGGLLIANRNKEVRKSSAITGDTSSDSKQNIIKVAAVTGTIFLALLGWFGVESALQALYTPQSLKALVLLVGLAMSGTVYWHKNFFLAGAGIFLVLLAPFVASVSTGINSIPEKGLKGVLGGGEPEFSIVRPVWKGVAPKTGAMYDIPSYPPFSFNVPEKGHCLAWSRQEIKGTPQKKGTVILLRAPNGSPPMRTEVRTLSPGETWVLSTESVTCPELQE